MKVAFIINDFDSMNLEKDTSIFLMNEAYNRGYEVFSFGVNEVTYKSNNLFAECEKVNFPDPSLLSFTKENTDLQNLRDFDYVINRVTPPFNKEYLYLTQLLDLAKIKCINPTQALREENEKLVILNFPELIPVTKVTTSLDEIRNMFEEGYKKIVIKPLDGMGGKSIFSLSESDKNINVIWETITQNGRKHVMLQEYVDEAKEGDTRIVFINYKMLNKKVVRVPSADDFRGNLAVGAKYKVEDTTEFDKKIAKQIIPFLKERNIYFAGADFLGKKLSEINITSPTCLQEIHKNSDLNPSKIFWDNIGNE